MNPSENPRVREWRHPLLLATSGLLLFETISGLVIWMLAFSPTNQAMVLMHTLAGLLFLLPACVYMIRHWRRYISGPVTHVVLTGYFAVAAVTVTSISGAVLTWQAAFGISIHYGWDLVHLWGTFAIILSVVPHLVPVILRARSTVAPLVRQAVGAGMRRTGYGALGITALLTAAVVVFARTAPEVPIAQDFPEDYSYLYGDERPFAPSMANTASGGAINPAALGGSQTCGTAGCHEQIQQEWSVSAHRWSAMDPAFRAVQTMMGEQNGPESTRYCGGCHDPISLFAGTKNLYEDELTNPMGLDEGVSCITCHGIQETDVQGNANYTLEAPERYLYETDPRPLATFTSNFLIRAYPDQHVESLQHTLFKSPEFCAACHKQFIDEEINNVGWVQLQNQYDNWRKSRWNHPGDPEKTIECRECHMPLVDSFDPASGDDADYNRTDSDGKHRSHRFLGANQFMPTHLGLEGGEEQVELTKAWLRGDFEIPEIADKWMDGPAVPIVIHVPESVRPGEEAAFEVEIINNKLGHDFPTGPLDIIQAWVEVTVTDSQGREVFSSGRRDSTNFIDPGTFMFKAEPVDQYGNLIDRHNLWEMVGVRYRRALFPGFSDRARYTMTCPSSMDPGMEPIDPVTRTELTVPRSTDGGELVVSARLLYRKVDQYLLNVLFGADSGVTSPVSELSVAEARIPVLPL